MRNQLLFFGYGYTASVIAKNLKLSNWSILGTSRSKTKCKYCQILDFNFFEIQRALTNCTHIIISIPPNDNGDIILQRFKNIIKNYIRNIKWIGYLSSTRVYGNHNGDWVDEQTKTTPLSVKGNNRKLAETQWINFGKENNIPINIFRLSRIYGPDRSLISYVRNGNSFKILENPVNNYKVFSMIHVDDIAQVIDNIINKKTQEYEIFNLSDDYPCSLIEIYNYTKNLLHTLGQQNILIQKVTSVRNKEESVNESKRVLNTKVKKKLNIVLKFSTYKEGIKNLIDVNHKDDIG